jgi:antitoxin component of MazEF toxin-antitoxin module
MNKRTRIKRTGNGAYIPVTREELAAMEAGIGTEVEVSISGGRMTVAKVGSGYERTRRSAERMGARYARTLELFGA